MPSSTAKQIVASTIIAIALAGMCAALRFDTVRMRARAPDVVVEGIA
jgi:hypothetical protein